MSGLDQLQYLSWLVYLFIFVLVVARAVRRPTPGHIDMALFFGAVAIVIVFESLASRLPIGIPSWVATDVTTAVAVTLGYLLLRLVADFSEVPAALMASVQIGMLVSVVAVILAPKPLPDLLGILLVGYLMLVIAYDAWAFARQARRNHGITRRRMEAAAVGSMCLVGALLFAGVDIAVPAWAAVSGEVGAAVGLASGICYYVAFAPPTWLRRAWQEPEVRAFLSRAARLPHVPDIRGVLHELERGAADALGASGASIALWDADTRRLRVFVRPPPGDAGDRPLEAELASQEAIELDPAERPIVGRAFLDQRALLVLDARRTDPEQADMFRRYGARTVLGAPITAGSNRLGVLLVYAPRSPLFANSDLELVQLLADQAAVILESRNLLDQAARVRAREEAARLKDDFLSSAAHDLKTPLTGIVAQAQVLRRRVERNPTAPADRAGLDRLVDQSLRLKNLVLKLLDVSRLEHGSLVGEREPTELGDVVQAMVKQTSAWKRVEVHVWPPVEALVDRTRLEQVVTNLIENALKYSPHDKPVRVKVWREGDEARVSVTDEGIGIPLEDQPLIFERFHRAGNVDDRRFAGMGLGLYISQAIVQQHGGRIWVYSAPGIGSTFHVALPALCREHADQSRPSGLNDA